MQYAEFYIKQNSRKFTSNFLCTQEIFSTMIKLHLIEKYEKGPDPRREFQVSVQYSPAGVVRTQQQGGVIQS